MQHFNPLPFGFSRHPFAHLRPLATRTSNRKVFTRAANYMENETPSRPGWTCRHPHTHTDPLKTPCRRLLCVSLYVKSYGTISPYPQTVPNNSPNVRSINVNKMDATAYPETRPICWIESDRAKETKNQTGLEKTCL